MAKTRLGFDISNSSVKIAAVSGSHVECWELRMPDDIMDDGEVAAPDSFSAFLRQEMKERQIKGKECALVFPARQVICRVLAMPKMNKEELALNLPYEFNEFVQNDPEKFFFDYAMCAPQEGDDPERMYMMAAAASKERIGQYIRIFSDAGLKLKVLLPPEMALLKLTGAGRAGRRGPSQTEPSEVCFVNLGHDNTSITVVKNDRVQATRQVDIGCAAIDAAIAETMNVDLALASSYKYNNFQGALDSAACQDVYQHMAVEILRVVNFYRFNFRDNDLSGMYFLGGGTAIRQLTERIVLLVELPVLPLEGLMSSDGLDPIVAAKNALAVGVAIR